MNKRLPKLQLNDQKLENQDQNRLSVERMQHFKNKQSSQSQSVLSEHHHQKTDDTRQDKEYFMKIFFKVLNPSIQKYLGPNIQRPKEKNVSDHDVKIYYGLYTDRQSTQKSSLTQEQLMTEQELQRMYEIRKMINKQVVNAKIHDCNHQTSHLRYKTVSDRMLTIQKNISENINSPTVNSQIINLVKQDNKNVQQLNILGPLLKSLQSEKIEKSKIFEFQKIQKREDIKQLGLWFDQEVKRILKDKVVSELELFDKLQFMFKATIKEFSRQLGLELKEYASFLNMIWQLNDELISQVVNYLKQSYFQVQFDCLKESSNFHQHYQSSIERLEGINDSLLSDLTSYRQRYQESMKTNRYLRKKNLKLEKQIQIQHAELKQGAEYFNDLKEENFKLNTIIQNLDESDTNKIRKSIQQFYNEQSHGDKKKKIKNITKTQLDPNQTDNKQELSQKFLNNDDIQDISLEIQEIGVNTSMDNKNEKIMVDQSMETINENCLISTTSKLTQVSVLSLIILIKTFVILYDFAIQCELPIIEKFAFDRGPQQVDAQSEQIIQYLEEAQSLPEDLKLDQLELIRQTKSFKYDLSKLFSPSLDKEFSQIQNLLMTVISHDEKIYKGIKEQLDEKEFQINELKLQLEFLQKDYKFKIQQFSQLENKQKESQTLLQKMDQELNEERRKSTILEQELQEVQSIDNNNDIKSIKKISLAIPEMPDSKGKKTPRQSSKPRVASNNKNTLDNINTKKGQMSKMKTTNFQTENDDSHRFQQHFTYEQQNNKKLTWDQISTDLRQQTNKNEMDKLNQQEKQVDETIEQQFETNYQSKGQDSKKSTSLKQTSIRDLDHKKNQKKKPKIKLNLEESRDQLTNQSKNFEQQENPPIISEDVSQVKLNLNMIPNINIGPNLQTAYLQFPGSNKSRPQSSRPQHQLQQQSRPQSGVSNTSQKRNKSQISFPKKEEHLGNLPDIQTIGYQSLEAQRQPSNIARIEQKVSGDQKYQSIDIGEGTHSQKLKRLTQFQPFKFEETKKKKLDVKSLYKNQIKAWVQKYFRSSPNKKIQQGNQKLDQVNGQIKKLFQEIIQQHRKGEEIQSSLDIIFYEQFFFNFGIQKLAENKMEQLLQKISHYELSSYPLIDIFLNLIGLTNPSSQEDLQEFIVMYCSIEDQKQQNFQDQIKNVVNLIKKTVEKYKMKDEKLYIQSFINSVNSVGNLEKNAQLLEYLGKFMLDFWYELQRQIYLDYLPHFQYFIKNEEDYLTETCFRTLIWPLNQKGFKLRKIYQLFENNFDYLDQNEQAKISQKYIQNIEYMIRKLIKVLQQYNLNTIKNSEFNRLEDIKSYKNWEEQIKTIDERLIKQNENYLIFSNNVKNNKSEFDQNEVMQRQASLLIYDLRQQSLDQIIELLIPQELFLVSSAYYQTINQ